MECCLLGESSLVDLYPSEVFFRCGVTMADFNEAGNAPD